MPDSRYVIVGGGMAAAAAVRGIREVDPDGSIALVGEEPDPPYKRPPLSKGLWAGKPLDRIWSGTERTEGVTLHPGRTVRLIDPAAKRLVDDHGTVHGYHKLLLATGSAPRRLPFNDGGQVIYFRTLGDYRRLRDLAERGQRFAVIGGGFIGSEIAASLASLAAGGKQVTLIFPGRAIGDRLFPADLAQSLNQAYRGHGVEVLAGHRVTGLERRGDGCVLRLRSGEDGAECERELDGVVAGIGTLPRIELAQASGLEAGDGIIVDRFLRTSHPDIYAAGDVANAWSPALGTRRRVEHEDNAKTMGRQAGRAMAGQPEPWIHLPYFYSDMFEQGYEAVGEVDSRLETVADWDDPFRTGTVRYLADGRVRGVLLWNVWDQVDAARDLIQAGGAIVSDRHPVAAR